MRKTTTPAQRATAVKNGTKGKGPVTPEGKARSSKNALKHGFTCEFILLPGESHVEFEQLKRAYIDRIQPRDAAEYSLVEQMVQCDWEMHRAWNDQRFSTYDRIDKQRKTVDSQYVNPSPAFRIAVARKAEFTKDGAYLQILERHLTRIDNRASRALRRLISLRKDLPAPAPPPETPQAAAPPPAPAPAQPAAGQPAPGIALVKSSPAPEAAPPPSNEKRQNEPKPALTLVKSNTSQPPSSPPASPGPASAPSPIPGGDPCA